MQSERTGKWLNAKITCHRPVLTQLRPEGTKRDIQQLSTKSIKKTNKFTSLLVLY